MSFSRGTVGKPHGCLYVPDLQRSLESVLHVCKDLGGYFIMVGTSYVDTRRHSELFSTILLLPTYTAPWILHGLAYIQKHLLRSRFSPGRKGKP
jgi:hypothetical protein